MDCSMPGFPLLHDIPECAQIHVFESVMPSNGLIAITPFSSCRQPFPASGPFPVSQLFTRRRQWHPTAVLLPGKSHGRRSLVDCSPWGRKELDMTSSFPFTFHFYALEKEMATHSSVLAWRIPGMGEPGGLPSMGSHRIGHD